MTFPPSTPSASPSSPTSSTPSPPRSGASSPAAIPPSHLQVYCRIQIALQLSNRHADLLPALHHDGVWTSGYGAIVSYLSSKSLARDLDASLTAEEKADTVAYSAYLAAHVAPLLDLSLYASAANWAATTRPAYSTLLPFPLTWTVPPLLRAEALKRVEHLGMAELDSDFDPSGTFHLSGRDSLPETFRRHIPVNTRKTVREEMTPEQLIAIRLCALTEDCLSVVNGLMLSGEGQEMRLRFFDSAPISSFDCLAFGYLALMKEAPVPRAFLKECLEETTPLLSRFVENMKTPTLGFFGHPLPWAAAESTAGRITTRTLDTCVRSIPSLGEHYANELRTRADEATKGFDQRTLAMMLSFMVTGAAVGYGIYVHRTMQPFGSRYQVWRPQRQGSRLGQFGELGSMLSSAMGPMPGAPGNFSSEPRFVETDTEVD